MSKLYTVEELRQLLAESPRSGRDRTSDHIAWLKAEEARKATIRAAGVDLAATALHYAEQAKKVQEGPAENTLFAEVRDAYIEGYEKGAVDAHSGVHTAPRLAWGLSAIAAETWEHRKPSGGARPRCKPDLSERCWALEELLHPEANDRRTGLSLILVSYGPHGEHERISGVALRRNARDRTRAIQLNLCPFCGVELVGEPRVTTEKSPPLAPAPSPPPEPPDWGAA